MQYVAAAGVAFVVLCVAGCTIKHKIEPSDQPFVVNMNIKIDHEIRMKIQDENADLLNLEDQAMKQSSSKKE